MKKITLFIINSSRPKFWVYLFGPFLLGYMFAFDFSSSTILSTEFLNNQDLVQLVLGLFYFLLPANLFLYGINDYHDFDTDMHNPKKGSKEVKLKSKDDIKKYLYISLAFFVIYLFILPTVTLKLLLILFLFLSYIYSSPPFRLKAKPIVDSSSNLLYFLPGVISYNLATGQLLPWYLWISFFCWTFSMHLFSAVPDITADKKANLFTTAILFGYKKSLILCGLMWFIFSAILIYNFGLLLVPTLIYFIIPLLLVLKNDLDINNMYWRFPYINAFMGFLGFILIVFRNFLL
mgnify:CR=1 FL=1